MTLAALIERSKTEREAWRYTSLKTLAATAFAPVGAAGSFSFPQPAAEGKPFGELHRLVFVDGAWQPEQSRLLDLPPDIMRGDAAGGYELTLAGQTCLVTTPIELLFFTTPRQHPVEMTTKLRVTLGDSGRLTLIERHGDLAATSRLTPPDEGVRYAHMVETTINLGAQAKLVHGKILRGDVATAHFARTVVTAARGAYYDNFTLLSGAAMARNEIDVTLAETLAQCGLHGLMLLGDGQHADTTTRITHAAAHGTSRQIYKTVLTGKAHGVFQGKIAVAPDAQKTDGHQLSRALLLSDQAEMDAKPELEIYADDVKCSHGSTIGDLDAQAMFYLRSRGIDEATARALLLEAFVSQQVNDIQVPELQTAVAEAVAAWLGGATDSCTTLSPKTAIVPPPSRGRLGGGALRNPNLSPEKDSSAPPAHETARQGTSGTPPHLTSPSRGEESGSGLLRRDVLETTDSRTTLSPKTATVPPPSRGEESGSGLLRGDALKIPSSRDEE